MLVPMPESAIAPRTTVWNWFGASVAGGAVDCAPARPATRHSDKHKKQPRAIAGYRDKRIGNVDLTVSREQVVIG